MKKTILVCLIVLTGSLSLHSQGLGIAMNYGVLTDKSFKFSPLVLSGNIEFDFHLGNYMMISPEVTFYTNTHFDSNSMSIAPGVVMNFLAGPVYLGGGLVKTFALSGGGSSPFNLKLSAILCASNFRFGAYMLTPFNDIFKTMQYGFIIGFEF